MVKEMDGEVKIKKMERIEVSIEKYMKLEMEGKIKKILEIKLIIEKGRIGIEIGLNKIEGKIGLRKDGENKEEEEEKD